MVTKGYGPEIDLMEETGLEAKLSRISSEIASRLANAMSEARNRRDSEGGSGGPLADRRAWASNECPENILIWAEAAFFENDRVVAALTSHLVEHVALGEEIRAIAFAARARAAEEVEAVPAGMGAFLHRLVACGVSRDDVFNMSKARLEAVVSAIRRDGDASVPDDLPGLSGNVANSRGDDSGRVSGNAADLQDVSGGDRADDAGAPVSEVAPDAPAADGIAPQGGEETGLPEDDGSLSKTGADAPVDDAAEAPADVRPEGPPATRWGVLDLERIGYAVEVSVASTDADARALKMRMPEVDRLEDLAVRGTPEFMSADGIVSNRNRAMVDRFFDQWSRRTKVQLTPAERRVWTLLLVEMQDLGKGRSMGAGGWFDGLSVPLGDGSTRVARLRALDRSDEGLRDALEGAAGG